MERYWSLRWLRQEGTARIGASVIKGDVLRVDGMPFITRLPGLPELPRGQRLELDVLGMNEIDLVMEARVHRILAAQAPVDPEDEEIVEDEAASEPDNVAAPEPPVIDAGGDVEQRGPDDAASSSEDSR
jgi:exoribonuclease-2